MQKTSRSTRTSRASRPVAGCSYNQKNLSNVLPTQCFDQKLLFGRHAKAPPPPPFPFKKKTNKQQQQNYF